MPNAELTRDGPVSVPLSYTVPNGGEMLPLTVRATMDGTSAASSFYATLQVLDPNGRIMGNYISTSVAAGASADVTWFPKLRPSTGATSAPSPNPLGNLWAWYDFSDTTTITVDGSGNILTIKDKTGNAHDATQPITSQRPAQSTLNGLNCGLFNSAAFTVLVASGWSVNLPSPYTYAVVWTQTVASSANYQPGPVGGWEIGGDASPNILFDNFDNTNLVMEAGVGSILKAFAAPYTQQQATMIFNNGASSFRLNGTATAGATNEKPITNVALGSAHWPQINAPEVENMDGKIGEVLIYSGVLSASQLTAVESYLKTKWGTP